MESFLNRYRNAVILVVVIFAQVIGLATQIKRPKDPTKPGGEQTLMIRHLAVGAITPFERVAIYTGSGLRNTWHAYVDLHDVHRRNQALQDELDRLRLEQVRLHEDAAQAHRLQALLAFKEQYIAHTVAAQVVGTSGSEQSRILYIDKGSDFGLKVDMPVITPDGVVGKIKEIFDHTAQVLEINDVTSGAGIVLEKTRLRGVLRGSTSGRPEIIHVMSDEKVEVGERVITMGGDHVYPLGLPVGTVENVEPDRDNDPFLLIRVKPFANLDRLDEVLVVVEVQQKAPEIAEEGNRRAADILAERLPGVKPQPTATDSLGALPSGNGGASTSETQTSGNTIPPRIKASPTPAGSAPARPLGSPAGDGSKALTSKTPPVPAKRAVMPAVTSGGAAAATENGSASSAATPTPTPRQKPVAPAAGGSVGIKKATPTPSPTPRKGLFIPGGTYVGVAGATENGSASSAATPTPTPRQKPVAPTAGGSVGIKKATPTPSPTPPEGEAPAQIPTTATPKSAEPEPVKHVGSEQNGVGQNSKETTPR